MVININPNRINPARPQTVKTGEHRRQEHASHEAASVGPARAHVNIIPEPESLATLIRSAVASFRKGIFWDRGTILNLLV